MNWLKKYSKFVFLIFLMTLFSGGFCYAEVLSGGIRKEYIQQPQRQIEIPSKEPVYSSAAIIAYNKGISEYKLSNYDKSIEYFNLAVKQEPRFADAYFNLGILYDYFENPSSAIIAFNRAYVINKKDYESLYYMIKCYVLLGDNVAARFYFNKLPKESEFYTKAEQILK